MCVTRHTENKRSYEGTRFNMSNATQSGAISLKYTFNPLNSEINSICHLLALLGVHFLHVSRIRFKSLTLRLLMSYIYIYI